MYGYIYETTNLINGKKYIGQHQSLSQELDIEYLGSGILLKKAVEKYGRDNFISKILEPVAGHPTICDSKSELDAAERFYIEYYDAINSPKYYNVAAGGRGGDGGPSVRQKISKSHLGKNTWSKGRVAINKNGKLKRVTTDELEAYLAEGWVRGALPKSKESIEKQRATMLGKSDEEKQLAKSKRLESRQKSYAQMSLERRIEINTNISNSRKGIKPWNAGIPANQWMSSEHLEKFKAASKKPKSDEHKARISQTRKDQGVAAGPNNPMYGKGYKIKGAKNKNSKKVQCIETEIIYDCINDAAIAVGTKAGNISACLRGRQHTAAGKHWRYI